MKTSVSVTQRQIFPHRSLYVMKTIKINVLSITAAADGRWSVVDTRLQRCLDGFTRRRSKWDPLKILRQRQRRQKAPVVALAAATLWRRRRVIKCAHRGAAATCWLDDASHPWPGRWVLYLDAARLSACDVDLLSLLIRSHKWSSHLNIKSYIYNFVRQIPAI